MECSRQINQIQRLGILLPGLGIAFSLGMVLYALPSLAKPARPGQSQPEKPLSTGGLRLTERFPLDIQKTLDACLKQGYVNLAAGADRDGSVICGNKSRNSPVSFNAYVNTFSDLLAASGLIGFRTAIKADSRISAELFATKFSSSPGENWLREMVHKYVAGGGL